jgi:hypothetical protein
VRINVAKITGGQGDWLTSLAAEGTILVENITPQAAVACCRNGSWG